MPVFAQIDDSLWEVFKHAQSAIIRIEEDQIFLNPQSIYEWEDNLCIENDYGEFIILPITLSKGHEYIVQSGKMRIVYICTNIHCQWRYSFKPERCRNCGNTTFIIRYEPIKVLHVCSYLESGCETRGS